MPKKRTATIDFPTFSNIPTVISYDTPRCSSCNCIYSLTQLDNTLNVCNDCLQSSSIISEQLDELKEEYSELESNYDRVQTDSEDFESELGQLLCSHEELSSDYHAISDNLRDRELDFSKINAEYIKMYDLVAHLKQEYEIYPAFKVLKDFVLKSVEDILD